ncbi:MAG TPA: HD domain-containing protein, partial [Erysipelothrix sp.]
NDCVSFVVYGREEAKHPYPVIQGPKIATSSTAIRQGTSCLTDKKVLRYMVKHHLYTKSILAAHLSEQRLAHTLRVKDLALELAAVHGIDENKVKIAALWHDFHRENQTAHLDLAPYLRQEITAYNHAYLAADQLARHYYYSDKHVLKAIRHHVNGQANNDIAKILFIADKCERGRQYDSEPYIRLSKKDLNEGFKAVKAASEAYLRRNKNE